MFTCDVTKDRFFAHKILLAVNYCLFAHSGVSFLCSMAKMITLC